MVPNVAKKLACWLMFCYQQKHSNWAPVVLKKKRQEEITSLVLIIYVLLLYLIIYLFLQQGRILLTTPKH